MKGYQPYKPDHKPLTQKQLQEIWEWLDSDEAKEMLIPASHFKDKK